MRSKFNPSRRTVVSTLVVSPMIPTACFSKAIDSSDAVLIELGRQFDRFAAQIDQVIDGKLELVELTFNQLNLIQAQILSAQATTIDGLRVKARAACWARLGDLDDASNSTTDDRMALSIVRDLIRLHDPRLEQPGALKKLVADLEN